MAERRPEDGPPGAVPVFTAFDPSGRPSFRQNAMVRPSYPTSLAFWNNQHLVQPIPEEPQNRTSLQPQATSAHPEQKKHKRTRSGCFTCRSRRIKCDETRPICERCSKGKRDCVYPPPAEPRRGSRPHLKNSEKHPSILETDSEDDGLQPDSKGRQGSLDENPHDHAQRQQSAALSSRARNAVSRRRSTQSLATKASRAGPESVSSTAKEKSTSPPTDLTPMTSGSFSPEEDIDFGAIVTESPLKVLSDVPGAANLNADVRFFLAYRREHLSSRHYFFKYSNDKFLFEDMLAQALEYEPLLYAIVGFSAYHYTVAQPDGKLYMFLQYYNRAISSLLKSLQAGDPHTDAMVLTILQLIAFEEYLGDWVNLIDHQQAAYRMILELYTPDDILVDDFHRAIVTWYSRFDVMAGMLGGNSTILSRDWYMAFEVVARQMAIDNPHDVDKQISAWSARNRQLAMETASLFAKASHNFISPEDFALEDRRLNESIEESRRYLSTIQDSRYLVTSFPNKQPLGPEDIVDPYVPGTIYTGPLWNVNYCMVELNGARLMYKYQTAMMMPGSDMSELRGLALAQCRIIETMLRITDRPRELLLTFRNTIGFIALFISQDEAGKMWCRRKLAMIEQLGYVYPPRFRTRMADMWKQPEIAHWWLPNDEGYPDIVREIREWTNERTTTSVDVDPYREAIRDIKFIFGKLNLDDTSPTSSPGAQSGGAHAETSPD